MGAPRFAGGSRLSQRGCFASGDGGLRAGTGTGIVAWAAAISVVRSGVVAGRGGSLVPLVGRDGSCSVDNAVRVVGRPLASANPTVGFRSGLLDSRQGPWEVTNPRSSSPGEESHSSLGSSKLPVLIAESDGTSNGADERITSVKIECYTDTQNGRRRDRYRSTTVCVAGLEGIGSSNP